MTVVGMWLAIVGYGIAFAGMQKIGGKQCGIIDAFRGKCGGATTTAVTSGQTQQSKLLANQQAQAGMIGTQPISQAA